jgi:hypothetical protein
LSDGVFGEHPLLKDIISVVMKYTQESFFLVVILQSSCDCVLNPLLGDPGTGPGMCPIYFFVGSKN